jgi:hypothetical protein
MPSRDKYPQGKRPLFVYINEDLYNRLREIAFYQHDKFHGALSRVVEEALRLYFITKHSPPRGSVSPPAPAQSTQTAQTPVLQASSKDHKIRDNYEKVIQAYKRSKNIPDHEIICEIPEKDLVNIISTTIGYDHRTIKKWINNFTTQNLLKYDQNRRIFTVINSACLDIEHYLDQLKQESNA